MGIDDELDALGRIVACIKDYRARTDDYNDLFTNELIDRYLNRCLVPSDYLFWQHLQADERTQRTKQADSISDEGLSLEQFNQLLHRYKRIVYERFLSSGQNSADK